MIRTICVSAVALAAGSAMAQVTPGIPEGAFNNPDVEHFEEQFVQAPNYTWQSGLVNNSLTGSGNLHNYTSGYGMGNAPTINGGRGGAGGYFGTGPSPESFEFVLPVPSPLVGWYGAEAVTGGHQDGVWQLEFYDANNNLIDALDEATPENVHAWDQFHGFQSATPIARVVFRGAGHSVVDDFMWIPAPGSAALLALGGLAATRRRR